MAKEYKLETEPESCLGLATAKKDLSDNPSIRRVLCGRTNCSAIIGYSKSSETDRGIAHHIGGSPRCSIIGIEAKKVERSLNRKNFPSPEDTKIRLEKKYSSLEEEARSLGILKEASDSDAKADET